MKKLFALVGFLFACTISVAQSTKTIDVEASEIIWKGYKIAGSHEGTIDIKSGTLTFENGQLTGGSIIVDMNSLSSTDLKGKMKDKLDNHLKSDDYFDVSNYPTATLMFSTIKKKEDNNYLIDGDLTIKNVTDSFSFVLNITSNEAIADVSINRKDFNVTSGSLKDKAVKDKFELGVKLSFLD